MISNTNTKNTLTFFFFSSFAIFFSSCQIDDTSPNAPEPHNYSSFDSYYKDSLFQTTKQTINLADAIDFTSNSGTSVYIEENQLLFPNGSQATGDAEIQLIELTKKSDLISSGLSLLKNDGSLLEMIGGFSLTAWKNNEALNLNDQANISFDQINPPSNPDSDISVYYTGADNSSPLELGSANQNYVELVGDTYELSAENLGWIVAAQDYNSNSSLTTLTVNNDLTSNLISEEHAYVIFNDFNGIVKLPKNASSFSIAGLPVGHSATVVMTALDPSLFYFASQEITITENQTLEINMRGYSAADFPYKLRSID